MNNFVVVQNTLVTLSAPCADTQADLMLHSIGSLKGFVDLSADNFALRSEHVVWSYTFHIYHVASGVERV